MTKFELMDKTKRMAIATILLLEKLPARRANLKISDQVIRSCTSVGANYRAACRAKSNADFINKLKIVEEEADETMYFLEILIEINRVQVDEMKALHSSYNDILAIIVSSIKTLRAKQGVK